MPLIWMLVRRIQLPCWIYTTGSGSMKIHHLGLEESLQSLHSGWAGLSSEEADRRFREFGPNRVEQVGGTPLVVRFLKGFTHFFALILWIAAVLAFLAEW